MRYGLILTCLGLAACGPDQHVEDVEDVEDVESAGRAITNGTTHTGHPSVGKLIFSRTGGTKQDGACTATLVGTKTVLSAAHCLLYPNTDWVSDKAVLYKSSKVIVHPKYNKSTPYNYDLGLVLLKSAPVGITPSRVAVVAPAAGTALSMIGYGETYKGAGDNGVKRIATNKVNAVKTLYFTITGASGSDGNACYGDSGGPVLIKQGGQEAVSGVLSYITGACGTNTYATRMDLYTSWLQKESGGDIKLLDLTAPAVTITSPANGATVATSVLLQATATDKVGVSAVEAQVDGVKQKQLTAAPYDFALTLQPGQRVLKVVATDAAGNSGSASITVTVAGPDAGPLDGSGSGDAASQGDASWTGDDRASDSCSVGGGGLDAAPAPLLLALALLLLLRRRRYAGKGRHDNLGG
jgi:MYXO-CTERM domain-containing protein